MAERVAIVGTAQTWRMAPWADVGIQICGLNDAYRLNWPRADVWYDLHPMSKFHLNPVNGPVYAHQVEPGHYVRPAGHVEWLQSLKIPLFLHEEPPDGWTHAQRFPKEAVEAHYGDYETSSPGWMLGHLLLQGAKEIHIYGIHLSTQHEYLEQRPNFEMLIGRALGPGKVTLTVADGLRHYESKDAHIVLPVASPVLQSPFQYAYQTRPASYLEAPKWELHKIAVKQQRRMDALKTRPWYRPWALVEEPQADGTMKPRRCSTTTVLDELTYLDAAAEDVRQQMLRLQTAGV